MAYVPFKYTERTYYHPDYAEDLMVGTMHTNYPLTWAGPGIRRTVGPSGIDNTTDLPGIGYDYTSNLINGHNVKASKDFFVHGPVRRQTP